MTFYAKRHDELKEEAFACIDDPETLRSILEEVFEEFRFLEERDRRVCEFATAVDAFADWQWGGYKDDRDPRTFAIVRDALWADVREHARYYTNHSCYHPGLGEQGDVPRSD